MHIDDSEASSLKYELTVARAEEAEALRHACDLRSRGAPSEDLQQAMREADARHSRVNLLHRELQGKARAPAPRAHSRLTPPGSAAGRACAGGASGTSGR
jgi:hypothetical protein